MMTRWVIVPLAVMAVITGWCRSSAAFRPFDGTDAAVADTGKVEIELGPVEYRREGATRTLFAPSTRVNYGFAPDWEAVVEGRIAHGLSGDIRGTGLTEDSVTLKGVLREGVLQEKAGPSIATEFGVLLPGIRADRGHRRYPRGHCLSAMGRCDIPLQCRRLADPTAARGSVRRGHCRRTARLARAAGRRGFLRSRLR